MPDFKPHELHVRIVDDDQVNVTLHFFLGGELHGMLRPRDEPLTKTLKRFVATLKKKAGKGHGKKKAAATAPPRQPIPVAADGGGSVSTTLPSLPSPPAGRDPDSVAVMDENGAPVAVDTVVNAAWHTGWVVVVGDDLHRFTVVKNPPTVTAISVFPKGVVLAGSAVVPVASTEFADGVEYEWCVVDDCLSPPTAAATTDNVEGNEEGAGGPSGGASAGGGSTRERVYVPPAAVVGRRLKVFCTPYRAGTDGHVVVRGRAATCHLSGSVRPPAAPALALDVRQEFIHAPRPEGTLRVVTYNTLAEPFATSDYALGHMFAYCPAPFLATEHRLPRVLAELVAYDADVVCLQECDAKVFTGYLQPALAARGYSGHYTNKSAGVMEGCATFTKDASLTVLKRVDVPLKHLLRRAPYLSGIYGHRPDLQDVLGGKLGSVGQYTVCQCTGAGAGAGAEGTVLVLANTHLFYHPAAAFVRLLQTDALMQGGAAVVAAVRQGGVAALDTLVVEGEETADTAATSSSSSSSSSSSGDGSSGGGSGGRRGEGAGAGAVDEDALVSRLNATSLSPPQVRFVLLGDLNSTPETAAIEYLYAGAIAADHEVWGSVHGFRWGARAGEEEEEEAEVAVAVEEQEEGDGGGGGGGGESGCLDEAAPGLPGADMAVAVAVAMDATEARRAAWAAAAAPWARAEARKGRSAPPPLPCPTPSLAHGFRLYSAAGFPRYTNFTGGFQDLLDYIFVEAGTRTEGEGGGGAGLQGGMEVVRVAPFPSHAQLSASRALPSETCPSDHVAVAVDLRVRPDA